MADSPANHKEPNQMPRPASPDCRTKGAGIDLNKPEPVRKTTIHDSESIYMKLIQEGTADHTIYGNLGAIRGMQGRHDDLIKLTQKALDLKPNHSIYLNNLGNAKKAKGDISEAINHYKKAITIDPKFAEAHNNLGVILREQCLFEEAIASFNKALRFRDNYAEAYDNLGVTLKEIGCLSEAIESHAKAINLKPDFSDAHYNLGNSLTEKGETEKALASYVRALEINPNHAKALVNAGNIFFEREEMIAAISAYEKAIQIDPNLLSAHKSLGAALEDQTNYKEASKCFTNCLNINPNDARAHSSLSRNLMHIGNINRAIEHAKKAISIEPLNSNYYCTLSKCERARGDFQASRLALHQALKVDPNNTDAFALLSTQIIDKADAEKLLQSMESINTQGLKNKELSCLEFAKANCFHKAKKYESASLHLSKANELKLSFRPSDLSKHLETNQKRRSDTNYFQDPHPQDGSNRIFIVGVPRCGSTLLESILATNPLLKDLGETNALNQAIAHGAENTNTQQKYNLSALYAEKIAASATSHTNTIDKNLYNFLNAHHIARSMPSAKIIHCHRHPLDNILSMLRANLVAGNNYSSDPADAATMIVMQEQVLKQAKQDYPKQIHSIEYDKLVNDPKKELKPLIAWLGLIWSENYLHPELVERTILTASVAQARKPISNKSVGGWKNYRDLLEPAAQILRDSKLFDNAIFEDTYPIQARETFSFI